MDGVVMDCVFADGPASLVSFACDGSEGMLAGALGRLGPGVSLCQTSGDCGAQDENNKTRIQHGFAISVPLHYGITIVSRG